MSAAALQQVAEFFTALDEQLPVALGNLTKQVVITALDAVATVTPVDTGAALSNWQVTLDAPATEEIPAYAPSQPGVWHGHIWNHSVDPEVTREANYPLVMDNGAMVIATREPGQDIFITNIVGTDKEPESYILELDKGRSPQFITGDFVGQAQIAVEQVLETATLNIK